MAYTHYWWRPRTLNREAFAKAVEDIRLIIETCEQRGVALAGPTGSGKPELDFTTVAFNGVRECGHRYRNLGKPWPLREATGHATSDKAVDTEGEPYYSGHHLNARTCAGDSASPVGPGCAHDPFVVDQEWLVADWHRPDEKGRYAWQCETRFKPYDLAVTAALIRLKERLGEEIAVASDADEYAFTDAKRLCRELFGWASRFELESKEISPA